MSSILLKKTLALCDPDLEKSKKPKNNNKSDVKSNARVTKLNKKEIIQSNRKITVAEAQQKFKEREQILKENLKRLRKSRKACKVKLSEKLTTRVIDRALQRKSLKVKEPKEEKVIEPTAFTEEDFKKFEMEYAFD